MTPLRTALERVTSLADLIERHRHWAELGLEPPELLNEARVFVATVATRAALMPAETYVRCLNDAEEIVARLERVLVRLDPFEALFYPHTSDGEAA